MEPDQSPILALIILLYEKKPGCNHWFPKWQQPSRDHYRVVIIYMRVNTLHAAVANRSYLVGRAPRGDPCNRICQKEKSGHISLDSSKYNAHVGLVDSATILF